MSHQVRTKEQKKEDIRTFLDKFDNPEVDEWAEYTESLVYSLSDLGIIEILEEFLDE